MREFFGFGGYERPVEGYLSWQHLTFVTFLIAAMFILAAFLGRRNCSRTQAQKNKVLAVAAILIDAVEIFKIIIMSLRGNNPWAFLYDLPLFLCSIQLITIPMAAFCRGRAKEAALDFVSIFGLLGAVLGTYGAGNNFAAYPVLSIDNVASGITHCISGFAALYILISGMASMKRENLPITFGVLSGFCAAAYIANIILDYNYMFLMRGDGTPYEILFRLTGGSPVLYPLSVVALFIIYICIFYSVYSLVTRKKAYV